MLNVYLNYPNSKVTVHGEATCSTIRQMRKPGQRQVRIDEGSREQELAQFEAAHRFASRAKYNDMWVVVDLASPRGGGRSGGGGPASAGAAVRALPRSPRGEALLSERRRFAPAGGCVGGRRAGLVGRVDGGLTRVDSSDRVVPWPK